ncbi:MAG: response regulator [Prochlorothrix sp.]|nr:response regulator [Prochlorothrix sp.]
MKDTTSSSSHFDFQPDTATILVVDDSRSNRAFLRNMLDTAGYQVLNAASGEEVFELLAEPDSVEGLPDLVLLDVILPGIDGFETCRRLKEWEKTQDIPVVFMTSLTETTDKVKGLGLGAVDYITKPLQAEEVKARLSVHLQLRYLTKTLEQQVVDRTADLQTALDDLKRMQMQLVQSEKMSALGQLVAGVAHEINNPVSCVAGNIKPAQNYVKDLFEIIETLLAELPEQSETVTELLEDLDFEFVQEDLPKLLKSMRLGADRMGASHFRRNSQMGGTA